ncbi:MAG: nuclear transport factor 2 family protein [Marmoricola sp.]|nr:nuclear transport factor 2 family protein [Marmoricola sp.]
MRTGSSEQVAAFFVEFEQASEQQDWGRYEGLFLDQFLSADPTSAGVVARDALITFLPHRKAVFERAGATGTTLVDLDVEQLDDKHVLASTTWAVVFDHDHDPVQLRSTFLLRHDDRWRIAVYLNHGNLLELLGLT